TRFSDFSTFHVCTAAWPSTTPEALGPRNCGQFWARAAKYENDRQTRIIVSRFIRVIRFLPIESLAPFRALKLLQRDPGVSLAVLAHPWLLSFTPSACRATHCLLPTAHCPLLTAASSLQLACKRAGSDPASK